MKLTPLQGEERRGGFCEAEKTSRKQTSGDTNRSRDGEANERLGSEAGRGMGWGHGA